MVEASAKKGSERKTRLSIIDCDIHNAVPSVGALKPYLSKRWQKYEEMIGLRGRHGYVSGFLYPKANPGVARSDAWPPSGLPPGADLEFMREQHLDALNIEYGILNCLFGVGGQLNEEFSAALARAVNDWQIAEWIEKEPRLRASIIVPHENAEFAAAEIDRVGEHSGFVQVVLPSRTREPLGRRQYWKIYEAAERHGLIVCIHVFASFDASGNPVTSSGWPSYYIEDQTGQAQAMQSQVISLVCEGVFDQFPGLRVMLTEGGFAWLPPLMWRLDKHWKRLRDEVPHLRRPPSEYIRDHMWSTTQPMEEPDNPRHLLQVIESFGSNDKLLFATDYPHWDFDAPDMAFPIKLPRDLEQRILSENARELYGFDK